MVLGNWALLAGVEPRQVNDWFLELFVDAFDWVVTPNVMGMSQHADAGFTSKPYVAGGAYIDRMSDHCARCPYDPRRSVGANACPFTTLYWDFTDRHQGLLASNPRTGLVAAAWRRRDEADRAAIRARAADVRASARGGSADDDAPRQGRIALEQRRRRAALRGRRVRPRTSGPMRTSPDS